jgi:SWI/SNF-related matrix-associated actin-dependent regulator of chromatin subfamily A-like protein 1
LINVDKLKAITSLALLDKYSGKNPYLKKLQRQRKKGNVHFTDNQFDYIEKFHNVEPTLINRVIAITPYIGEELKKKENLSFVPERILVQFILAETDKTFHVYGKLKKNQAVSGMYWLPKTQVLDDPYWEEPNIEVDFDKYAKLDKKGRKPYKHQEEGIKFLLSRDGCILADDMGLGKTYQSIVAALETGAQRILIVCPPSVKINWEREIQCFDNNTAIVNGTRWARSRFTIINYDILKNFHATKDQIKDAKKKGEEMFLPTDLVDANFDLAIIDEAHYLKNHKSKRGIIMKELCVDYGIDKVWLLTGTPVANRPMDFYNLLKLVKSPIVDNWVYFAKRYCEGKKFYRKLKNGKKASQPTWLTNGSSNLDELHIKTKNILLRRLKENVLDMPEKNLHTVYHRLTPTQRVEYDNLWEEYLLERKRKKKKGTVERSLVELILLRQYIANETVSITIEMAENAIEQGQKVIIFTSYQEEQELIMEHFGKIAVAHNGKMSTTQKQKSVDRFQDVDSVKVFVGNIISAGVGITLTAATTVIFNSLDWVPGNIKQAIDRAYRIGQKNNVSVYFNIFEETVDERVWATLFSKTDVIDTILGGKDGNMFEGQAVDETMLLEIIDNEEEDE